MGVNPKSYINVQGWMVSDLHLEGRELLLYSLIFGFSQDRESSFNGSLTYMQEWLGCSRPTVTNTLKQLIEKGLLKKTKVKINGIVRCQYVAIIPSAESPPQPAKSSLPEKQESEMSEKSKEIYASFSAELKQTVSDWYEYKRQRKEKYTPIGANKLISQIGNAVSQYGSSAVACVINRSMGSNYQGIVWDWLKGQNQSDSGGAGNVFMSMLQEEHLRGDVVNES